MQPTTVEKEMHDTKLNRISSVLSTRFEKEDCAPFIWSQPIIPVRGVMDKKDNNMI